MDVRYRNVSPLRVNTIETLYPELKKSGQNPSNNEQNAVYFNIDGNDIELVARILFYDDYGQKFIENGVELNKTYEDVILEGLKLWSGEFAGAYSKEENVHYDFIEGMKINVTFTAEVYHEEDLFSDNRYVHIYVENDEYTGGKWYDSCYGIPHTDTQGWSPEKIGTGILWDCGQITMYPRYKDKPVSYTEMEYQHTIAHEFGHVLGLDDAYPSANGGIKLEDNDEVPIPEIEEFYQGILMHSNGFSYANDFEMVFQAFSERKYQSYFEYKRNEKSEVIRLKQTFKGDQL